MQIPGILKKQILNTSSFKGSSMPAKKLIYSFVEYLQSQPAGFTFNEQVAKKSKREQLDALYASYKKCRQCPLAVQGRTQIVFGEGNAESQLMFIGEGPGKDEDEQGRPFVGRSGKLLTKIIEAMGIKRKDIFISNVVKCRPPGNRAPLPNESVTCKKLLLFKEIEIIKPKIICTLGATATKEILGNNIKITKIRGQFFDLNGIKVMPTFHPAFLLRNPPAKREVWDDMKRIIENLSGSHPQTKALEK